MSSSAFSISNVDLSPYATLASPNFTGTVTLPAGQVVNGVTLTSTGSATDFLNADGNYVAVSGTGDVVGPGSSTDNALARYDLATGKLIQNSVVIVDDSGNTTGMGTLASAAHTVTSNSATALVVGPNGTTNPTLTVVCNTASAANGISITSTAAGGNVTVGVTSSAGAEGLIFTSLGTGNVVLRCPSTGGIYFQTSGNNTRCSITPSVATFSPAVSTTAAGARFLYTAAADLTLTASTEAPAVLFDMSATRQHSTGAITTQRDFRVAPTTHSAVGSSTITTAATVTISGAPVAGANVTITNPYALWVESGNALFAGNVTATTFIGALTGNASTATSAATLTTPRNINGTSFNGSADITITAAAGTLTGATLAAGVTASSLTSVGTLTALTVSGLTTLNEIAIDGTPNTDDTSTGFTTSTFNAGATIAQWQLVYMGSGGEWLEADASAASTSGPVMLALAAAAGTDNNSMKVVLPGGFARNDAWAWTIGAALYVSETTGSMTETAPSTTGSIVRVAGYAVNADTVYFMPSGAWVEVP